MNRLYLTAVALALCCAASATDIDSLCYELALEDQSLMAERERLRSELLQGEADNSLAGPEAEFDYKFAPDGHENRWGLSVGQSFDWPGVYAARAKSNGLRSDAFAMLYRQNLADKLLEVKTAAIRLVLAKANLRVIAEAHDNLRTLVESIRRSYQRGEATILSLRKAELEYMSVSTAIAAAESEVGVAAASLETIQPGAAEMFKDITDIDINPLRPRQDYAASMSRSVEGLEKELEATRNDVSVARRGGMPSFSLAYVHDFEDGLHFNGFSVGISLPTWRPAKNVRLAEAKALAADFELMDYKGAIEARQIADYDEAARIYSRIAAEDRTLADDYPALLKKAYDAGIMTLFEYLTEYNSYLDIISAHNALKARYAELEARLSKNLSTLVYDR